VREPLGDDHLTTEELEEYFASDGVPERDVRRIERHLAHCLSCASLADQVFGAIDEHGNLSWERLDFAPPGSPVTLPATGLADGDADDGTFENSPHMDDLLRLVGIDADLEVQFVSRPEQPGHQPGQIAALHGRFLNATRPDGTPVPVEQKLVHLLGRLISLAQSSAGADARSTSHLVPALLARRFGNATLAALATAFADACAHMYHATPAEVDQACSSIVDQLNQFHETGMRVGDTRLVDYANGDERKLTERIRSWCARIDQETPGTEDSRA
jgi:hypothetical protein